MAGDWIKMRGALYDHPKVIAITRVLQDTREFRAWLTPGGAGQMNGQIVSHAALRGVTTGLLLKVWSAAREHGKFEGDDLVLAYSKIADLDEMAGAPGIGEAMKTVGWAIQANGVILPNFKQFNVPMTDAERQRNYRERRGGQATEGVTMPSRTERDIPVTRVEKSRVNTSTTTSGKPDAPFPFRKQAREVLDFLNEKTGRRYQPVRANLEMIEARIKEGASIEELRAVVAKKCREWTGNEKMAPYLRPATLFNRTKFAQYQGELRAVP